jgi:hypothetical protein
VQNELFALFREVADDEPRNHEGKKRIETQIVEQRAHAKTEHEKNEQHLFAREPQVRRNEEAQCGPDGDASEKVMAEGDQALGRESAGPIDEGPSDGQNESDENDDDNVGKHHERQREARERAGCAGLRKDAERGRRAAGHCDRAPAECRSDGASDGERARKGDERT